MEIYSNLKNNRSLKTLKFCIMGKDLEIEW